MASEREDADAMDGGRSDNPEAASIPVAPGHSKSTRPAPFYRSIAPPTPGGFIDLGTTPLVRALGLALEQTNGHWCSRCRGIWFGYTLETQCPVCGNRKG